ncbi:MAG: exo-alpha-sialidase [Prolixibacteraceae bacterium]|nr:exo-alpha-sialidase [Prolixibacteraceae bacterium]MBN2775979.1 exo-alpha-sialidase [Prolixibacteraceae bacterium]
MQTTKYILIALIIAASILETAAQPDTKLPEVELIENELIFTEAPFKQCHASSLAELSNGNIMGVLFGGTYERHPDVCIWGSVKSTEVWSKPVLLADGIINDSVRYPTWNPVLFKTKNDELYLFYKVGPSPDKWWGMYKKSTDDGQTWSEPIKLQESILGPVKNKPICLPGGRIISPSSVERGNIWNAHMELSDDDGNTWSKVLIDTTTGFKLIQPTLLTLSDGTILALMRSDQNCIVESRSEDMGATWSKPEKTNIPNPNSGIDAVTLKTGLLVLVYNPESGGEEWSKGRNKLYVMISEDGNIWRNVYKLEDKTSGEYSYPAIIETSDGSVHISYTYNRVNIKHVVLKF